MRGKPRPERTRLAAFMCFAALMSVVALPALAQDPPAERESGSGTGPGGGGEIGTPNPDDDRSDGWTAPGMVPVAPNDTPGHSTAWASAVLGDDGSLRRPDGIIVFDDGETAALIAAGWGDGAPSAAGAPSTVERVRLFIRLAVQQGYPAHFGALQAQYGTPQEHGLVALQRRIDALTALPAPSATDIAELDRLRADLVSRAADVKPGPGPMEGWELVDLDVNGDGRIDAGDLN